MTNHDNRDNTPDLLAAYGAPPPRDEFVERLRGRLQDQLAAAQAARRRLIRLWYWVGAAAVLFLAVGIGWSLLHNGRAPPLPPPDPDDGAGPIAYGTPQDQIDRLVPLEIELPRSRFTMCPTFRRPDPHVEKYEDKPRPPFFVPKGTVNLSRGKPVTSSDVDPIIGKLEYLTDGDKDGTDGSYIELLPGLQWVQIDLGRRCRLYAIVVWHYWAEPRAYHDVIIQASDDPAFKTGVRTLFNNDFDNSAGLGLGKGKDLEYVEDYRGRLIDAGGVTARYVRLYSAGNSSNDQNHYTEVEVFGEPAPADVSQ